MKYEEINLSPLLYQDDIFDMSNSAEAAQISNNKMEDLLESKLLDLNSQKSCFIITGGMKGRKRLEREVENSPLMIYNTRMKQVTAEKYLGMQLAATAAASVTATVNKRLGLATRAIYEARAVVEDRRSESVGGIITAFEIWERSIIPMLLFSCEIWPELPKKTLKSLDTITIKFLRVTLGLGKKSGPIASLYWSTGTYFMSNRILKAKLMFIHHLANLPEGLGKDFYNVQNSLELPGIVSDCKVYLEEWNLGNVEHYTKSQWRKTIGSKIYEKNRSECLEMMKGLKKIDVNACASEKFEMNSYFKTLTVRESRLRYRIKYFLTPTVCLNFKNDKVFKAQNYLCQDCLPEDITEVRHNK